MTKYETQQYDDSSDPWVIPIHGIEAPIAPSLSCPVPQTEDAYDQFFTDDDLPSIEFRPRLRRSA